MMADIRGYFKRKPGGSKTGGKSAGGLRLGLSSRRAAARAGRAEAVTVDKDEDQLPEQEVEDAKGTSRRGSRRGSVKKESQEGGGRRSKKRRRVAEEEDEDWVQEGEEEEEVADLHDAEKKKGKKKGAKDRQRKGAQGSLMQEEKDAEEPPKKKKKFNPYQKREPPPNLGKKALPKGAPDCLQGKVFVITGVLDSLEREDAMDLIKEYAGRVVSGVSKKVTHALVGTDPGQSKMSKLKANKVPMIDEDQLFEMINKTYKGPPKEEEADRMIVEEKADKKPGSINDSASKPFVSPSVPMSRRKSAVEAGGTSSGVELWVDKYKPKTLKDLCANPSHVKSLTSWLETWKQNFLGGAARGGGGGRGSGSASKARGAGGKAGEKGHLFRAALLAGPPGVGKTTFAHIVAREVGFEPHELNASDVRNKSAVASLVGDIVMSHAISKYLTLEDTRGAAEPAKASKRKAKKKQEQTGESLYPKGQVLIMDEVDGMSGSDRGGMTELVKLIKTTNIPIICICNDDSSQKVRTLTNYCLKLKFRRPMASQVVKRLATIAQREGFRSINAQTFEKIAESCHGDIRQMINLLQSWRTSSSSLTFTDVKNRLKNEGKTFENLSVFDVASSLFRGTGSLSDRLDSYFYDSDLMPLFVQDAYVNSRMVAGSLEALSSAAEAISLGDICSAVLRENQRWDLMPSHGILSTVLPSRLAPNLGARITFPQWLGKLSMSRKFRRLNLELDLRCKPVTLCSSGKAFRVDYVPALTRCLAMPLVTDGREGVPEVIDMLNTYYMTKTDFETMMDLGVFQVNQSPKDNIDAQVKTALTRAYNAADHRICEVSNAHVGSKGRGSNGIAAIRTTRRDGENDIADNENEVQQEEEEDEAQEAESDSDIKGLIKGRGSAKKGEKRSSGGARKRKGRG